MIGGGNILKPRLPLVRVPRMFLQYRYSFFDGVRVLMLKDLIRDGGRQHVAGDVPGNGGAGKRHDGG